MEVYVEASGNHTLLVCTSGELSILLTAMGEASRLSHLEGRELLPGTSYEQATALLTAALAEKKHLRSFRAAAPAAEGDFVVVGAVLSVTVRISEHLKQLFIAALRYFVEEVERPFMHTLLGALPDELWVLHYDLVGKYPGPLSASSRP